MCVCVIAFVGKTLTLTEKKALEVLPSHVRSLHVGEWALTGLERERESKLEKAVEEIKWTSFVCLLFLAALQDGGLLK